MKPIRIDFAPRTLRYMIARTHWAAWVAGIVGALLCIAAGAMSAVLQQQRDELNGAVLHAKARLAQRTSNRPVPKKTVISEAQATSVNAAIAQLNLPWRDVFNAIEAATPPTIALLTVEPDARRQVLKGLAEAKNSDGMITYIEQLKQQAFFSAVVLTRHEINEHDPNKPIRFQFEAQWAGSAP